MMKSALYTGSIRHRRFGAARNEFRYRLFMSYLDLGELATVFERRWLWSTRRLALAWFRRADFLGPPEVPLDTAVRDLVAARTGVRPRGPIRLLTHLRFFGYSFNPVSFYYVFDAADTRVDTVVAEITNTPWKERYAYVLPVSASTAPRAMRFRFDKQFHVSPFLPMDLRCHWTLSAPGAGLHVHMENWRGAERIFDATLRLRREEITGTSLARALARFPLMTAKVTALIYWQALKLWLKRAPFHVHPDKLPREDLRP